MAKKVVTVGGGTGMPVVLEGLKHNPDIELTAIVTVTDSGGSTGRLREEFNFLPVGDLRQCLAALADPDLSQEMFELLYYRFGGKGGLKGHNLGNLILTAFEDIKKSPAQAVAAAAKLFRTRGNVYPVTETVADLIADFEDGTQQTGEHFLDDHTKGGKKLTKLSLTATSPIYEKARAALVNADLIILGPGDLYGSLLPPALTEGFGAALEENKGTFAYIVNLMTHYSQTHDLTAQDHIDAVVRYCGRTPDSVLMNTGVISEELLQAYAAQKEYPVVDDLPHNATIIRGEFVSQVKVQLNSNDELKRSLLRHDDAKLAAALQTLL
jgi:uncharacterized cofD-like protein